jgi:hypothetical protein
MTDIKMRIKKSSTLIFNRIMDVKTTYNITNNLISSSIMYGSIKIIEL